MDERLAEQALRRLASVMPAKKSFDAPGSWAIIPGRNDATLSFTVALRLDGALGGGASVRVTTPSDTWETDVYGHIEVAVAGIRQRLRLLPISWRPRHEHRNPNNAPPPHRLALVHDRYHPFDLNVALGIAVFSQARAGIAVPLPRAISSFQEYAALCAEFWNCQDAKNIPVPPWSPRLV